MGSVCDQKAILKGLLRRIYLQWYMSGFSPIRPAMQISFFRQSFPESRPTVSGHMAIEPLAWPPKNWLSLRERAGSNWELFGLLAEAMGFEEPYFKRTEEEMLEGAFKPS